jgi:hypothetical protein
MCCFVSSRTRKNMIIIEKSKFCFEIFCFPEFESSKIISQHEQYYERVLANTYLLKSNKCSFNGIIQAGRSRVYLMLGGSYTPDPVTTYTSLAQSSDRPTNNFVRSNISNAQPVPQILF